MFLNDFFCFYSFSHLLRTKIVIYCYCRIWKIHLGYHRLVPRYIGNIGNVGYINCFWCNLRILFLLWYQSLVRVFYLRKYLQDFIVINFVVIIKIREKFNKLVWYQSLFHGGGTEIVLFGVFLGDFSGSFGMLSWRFNDNAVLIFRHFFGGHFNAYNLMLDSDLWSVVAIMSHASKPFSSKVVTTVALIQWLV